MPVAEQIRVNTHTGNGTTTNFAYTYRIFEDADLQVVVDGVTKTLTTDYTVNGADDAGGGSIDFVIAPLNLSIVTISGELSYDRDTDFIENGDMRAQTFDDDFDKATMLIQQLRRDTKRSIKVPIEETDDQEVSLTAANRANKVLYFDANGLPTAETVADIDSAVSTIGEGLQLISEELSLKNDYTVIHKTAAVYTKDPWFDIRTVASGSGTTGDPWKGWEAIINALPESARIYLPPGFLDLDTQVVLKNGWRIKADNWLTTVRLITNLADGMFYVGAITDVNMKGFKIDGQKSLYTSSANDGIKIGSSGSIGGAHRIDVEKVWVKDVAGSGVQCLAVTGDHSSDIRYLRNRVEGVGAHGLITQDFVDHVTIDDNTVTDWGVNVDDRVGIASGRSGIDHTVTKNKVYNNSNAGGTGAHGISVENVIGTVVDENQCKDVYIGYGLELAGIIGGSATGNVVKDQQNRAGIAIVGSTQNTKNLTLNGNTAEGGNNQGFYMFDAGTDKQENVTFNGDIAEGNGGVGFEISDGLNVALNGIEAIDNGKSGVYVATTESWSVSGIIKGNNTTDTAGHYGMRVANAASGEFDYILKDPQLSGNYTSDSAAVTIQVVVDNPTRTFTASDTTPDISGGGMDAWYETDTGAVTITNLGNGIIGMTRRIISRGATTYDTTGTPLTGSSVDIVTASGDITIWFRDSASSWILQGFVDVSADNSGGA